MSGEFRGRGRGMRGGRSRGGAPPRGGFRGGGRGGFSSDRDGSRGGYSRGRGDGFSPRGRGGISRTITRDDSPPRKTSLMSRDYESRESRPQIGRRERFDDSYDRGPPPSRSRDPYPSPPRDSSRIIDRLSPPRSSMRGERTEYGTSSREYLSSRGDFMTSRSYSPPRETGYSSHTHREPYSRSSIRDDDRDAFARPSPRDYPLPKLSSEYVGERREYRESPRDYGASRDYPPSRSTDFRSSMSGRGDFREPRGAPRGRDTAPRGRDMAPRERDMAPRERVSSRESRDYQNGSNGREYPSRRDSFSDRSAPLGERDYGSSRFSKLDDRDRSPLRGSRGRGGSPRGGGMRGGRDEMGSRGFMNGRGSRGPPRGRGGRPEYSSSRGGGGGRRSPPLRSEGPPRKATRIEGSESYRR